MLKTAFISFVLAFLFFSHQRLFADVSSAVYLVEAEELSNILDRVHVIDTRSRSEFLKEHIPGSILMDWRDWTIEKPSFLKLFFGNRRNWGKVKKSSMEVQEKLRALGFSQNKSIVVVGDSKGWGEEGRIAWNFLYWGAKEVALLNGGFAAWKSNDGFSIDSGIPEIPETGDFQVVLRPERRAIKEEVTAALAIHTIKILDTRSEEEYLGNKVFGQKRGGHLPGAIFFPHELMYENSGKFISKENLIKILEDKNIDLNTSETILYCAGGVRSALVSIILEAHLDVITKNYDGSMWEWSADSENKLTKKRSS